MRAVGVHICDKTIRLIELEQKQHTVRIRSEARRKLPAGVVENYRFVEPERLQELFKETAATAAPYPIAMENLFFALPESKVRTRTFTVPRDLTDQDIATTIAVQFPEYFPFPLEEAVVNWRRVQQSEVTQTIFVAAARRRYVEQLEELTAGLGIEMAGIDIESVCSARAILPAKKIDQQGHNAAAVIRFDFLVSSVSIFDERGVQHTVTLHVGSQQLVEQIATQQASDTTEARELLLSMNMNEAGQSSLHGDVARIIKAQLQSIVAETERLQRTYRGTHMQDVQRVYVCGAIAQIDGLDAFMSEELKTDVIVGDPFIYLSGGEQLPLHNDAKERISMSSTIGAALGCFPDVNSVPRFNFLDPVDFS